MAQPMTLKSYFSKVLPNIPQKGIDAVLDLHQQGATIPFIARYRKEKTGNLDELQIKKIVEAHEELESIKTRQSFLLKEIEKQGQLSEDLKARILASMDLNELEEIYRPFKKKKKTKATVAREAGLEPLAQWLWDLGHGVLDDSTLIEVKAKEFLNLQANIVTYESALKGAQDIIVERIYNNPDLRASLRKELIEQGFVVSKKGKHFKANSKYDMYADFKERVSSLRTAKASHRYLAMRRGWHESELTLTIEGELEKVQSEFRAFALSIPTSLASEFLTQCAQVALDQHVLPSISNEIHSILKTEADQYAVEVFSENVKKILLSSPFGSKWVLGVDPGLRTGCKLALVDQSGNYITSTVLNILDNKAAEQAKTLLSELVGKIEAVAVGNGTAGREAYDLFRRVVADLGASLPIILVNESGASIYSASDVAREEFPDLDITVRGAISIARRLQDPLAELVKIDPKSIGVGQYQHDVSQPLLKKNLDFVVESCVNKVGVDLNTASAYLLQYVSGIGPALAKNIVEHRKSQGVFANRDALLKVPQFSTKTFELAAGFLRVPNSQNPLDKTGIHPEKYSVVRDMAKEMGTTVSQLTGAGAKKILEERTKWAELVGEFTFDDIIKELEKPGRDPRDPFKVFNYRDDISKLSDLKPGMICPGIVTNVTNFGAFVDLGVHQDGLVHISELAEKFVDDPQKVVAPGDVVSVKVMGVNLEKNQISLTMKLTEKPPAPAPRERPPRQENQRRGPPRDQRQNFKKSGQGLGKPRNDRPRRPAPPPLNNPFAGLAALKDQLKK